MILISDNGASRLIDIITGWANPLFLVLFITLVIVFIVLFINTYLVKPIESKHIQEKKEIELRNSRMMALFAELDPDPVIRVDQYGTVNFFNEAAANLLNIKSGSLISDSIFNLSAAEIERIIRDNSNYSFPIELNGVHYNVLAVGNADIGIAQLYLRDVTSLKTLELKLKQLSTHLQNQLDEERFRIAQELHDGIVQELYLVQIGIGKIEDEYGFTSNEMLNSIKLQLKNTSEELRRIIYDLKPKILDEMGLEPALQTLCNNISRESGIIGSVEIRGIEQRLDKKLEIYFYRVIQEALSNVVKHSGASEFSVFLIKGKNSIKVIISDNGCGLKEEPSQLTKRSFGIMNIKERTEGLGGTLKIDSAENEGFTLIAEIPLK